MMVKSLKSGPQEAARIADHPNENRATGDKGRVGTGRSSDQGVHHAHEAGRHEPYSCDNENLCPGRFLAKHLPGKGVDQGDAKLCASRGNEPDGKAHLANRPEAESRDDAARISPPTRAIPAPIRSSGRSPVRRARRSIRTPTIAVVATKSKIEIPVSACMIPQ